MIGSVSLDQRQRVELWEAMVGRMSRSASIFFLDFSETSLSLMAALWLRLRTLSALAPPFILCFAMVWVGGNLQAHFTKTHEELKYSHKIFHTDLQKKPVPASFFPFPSGPLDRVPT